MIQFPRWVLGTLIAFLLLSFEWREQGAIADEVQDDGVTLVEREKAFLRVFLPLEKQWAKIGRKTRLMSWLTNNVESDKTQKDYEKLLNEEVPKMVDLGLVTKVELALRGIKNTELIEVSQPVIEEMKNFARTEKKTSTTLSLRLQDALYPAFRKWIQQFRYSESEGQDASLCSHDLASLKNFIIHILPSIDPKSPTLETEIHCAKKASIAFVRKLEGGFSLDFQGESILVSVSDYLNAAKPGFHPLPEWMFDSLSEIYLRFEKDYHRFYRENPQWRTVEDRLLTREKVIKAFSGKSAKKSAIRFFRAMGFDASRVRMDERPRLHLDNHLLGVFSPIEVPKDVRLVIRSGAENSPEYWATLTHELGHAAHATYVDQKWIADRTLPMEPWLTEAIGGALNSLAFHPYIVSKYLDLKDPEITDEIRLIGGFIHEFDIYQWIKPDQLRRAYLHSSLYTENGGSISAKLRRSFTKFPGTIPSSVQLYDEEKDVFSLVRALEWLLNYPLYDTNYVIASVVAARIHDVYGLNEGIDETKLKRLGGDLKKLFAEGSRLKADPLLEKLGLSPLGNLDFRNPEQRKQFEPYLASLDKFLQSYLKQLFKQ